MEFDLVDRRHDLGAGRQLVEADRQEVADADRAYLAVGEQFLQGLVGGDGAVEVCGQAAAVSMCR
ncbi:hypothetical protein [Actinoplanes subglobosus]|uniref:Uncharacterized protein n=1 Tax=Actinoplanes subglobosus TaxID=1547892 RepID=A0ABV8J226_9ACTN